MSRNRMLNILSFLAEVVLYFEATSWHCRTLNSEELHEQ